jgi:hypothetical protein
MIAAIYLTPERLLMPLTTKQVARLLGFHEKSVANMCRLKSIKCTRFGDKAYMIQPQDLREYVLNHSRPSRLANVDLHSLV